jgi:hypothetical protein
MNANTGAFVDPSKPDQDTYIVGQEPDTKGNPIPTKKLDESNDLLDVVANRKRIVEQTGGRGDAALGSWKTSEGVDLDASAMKSTEAEAMGLAQERGEKAIWSSKKFRESGYQDGDIMNPKYKG